MGVANLVSGLNLNVSQEWIDGINCFFLHADTNSFELKGDRKFFVYAWLKMSVASLLTGL